jgi:two-component system response regulator AtoC
MPQIVPLHLAPSRADAPDSAPIVLDREMQRLYREAEDLAAGRLPVLIVGETGVGKEHLAEVIHQASPRAVHPFVRINCAALTHSLFESELFGHERGAFTGGEREKPGLLEAAGRGTVFLDEVAELPLPLQAKLLRALETGAAYRVGGLSPRPIQARFVSATNRDLTSAMASGELRADLYYRLAGSVLTVPPLRARCGEIVALAERFAAGAARELGQTGIQISEAARAALLARPWPGNVRELRNAVERIAVYGWQEAEPEAEAAPPPPSEPLRPFHEAKAELLAKFERDYLRTILEQKSGNITAAAAAAGVDRVHFLRLLDRHGFRKNARGPAASPISV